MAIEKARCREVYDLSVADEPHLFALASGILTHNSKLNPMPESVQDRVVRAHEQIFMFAKQSRYYFDGENIREPHADFQRGNAPKHAQYGGHRAPGYEQEEHIIRWSHDESQRSYNPNGRACRSVWSLASEPTPYAHFATFPTELVRRILKAGAPAQVCSVCGKPHVRQVERDTSPPSYRPTNRPIRTLAVSTAGQGTNGTGESTLGMVQQTTTTGFSPTCSCAAPTRRSVVLDPFAGSGTVGLVARELGHDAVCLDLSLSYLHDIARERLGLAALQRWEHGATTRAECYEDLPLFGG